MPECTGFEAAQALGNDLLGSMVIIAFTALDASMVRRQMADNEPDGYCQKGESPKRLI